MKDYKNKMSKGGEALSKGMSSKTGKYPILTSSSKGMYGVDTMSEYYDMGRVQNLPETNKGQPQAAWDYKY